MKSSWRSPDGGSSVARNTKIEPCGAVFCAWWGTGSTPIRSFHTVSEGEFCELRRDGVLRSSFGCGFFPASQRIRACSFSRTPWITAACYDALRQTGKKLSEKGRPQVELVSRSTQEVRGLQWQVQTQGVLVLRALQHHSRHSAGVDRRPAWHPRLLCRRRVAERDLQPGGPHPYFGRDRKESPRHRSLGLVDTDRFGATDRSDSALGVRLAGRHAGRQPVWPEPERGHSQGGLRSVVRRTHPSAWKGYSRKSKA